MYMNLIWRQIYINLFTKKLHRNKQKTKPNTNISYMMGVIGIVLHIVQLIYHIMTI